MGSMIYRVQVWFWRTWYWLSWEASDAYKACAQTQLGRLTRVCVHALRFRYITLRVKLCKGQVAKHALIVRAARIYADLGNAQQRPMPKVINRDSQVLGRASTPALIADEDAPTKPYTVPANVLSMAGNRHARRAQAAKTS